MDITSYGRKYYRMRSEAFARRDSFAIGNKVILALGFAMATGLLAQVRFALPFTPVPVTGQTFGVLLAGVLLGRSWGGISMALYAGLGALGIPWFAGFTGGIGALAGPTGGYLFGFVLTALFLGYVTDKYVRSRKFGYMAGLMSLATLFLIFLPGLVQLGIWSNFITGNSVSVSQLLALGFYPFLIGAVVKIAAAAGIASAITPKE